jgi:TP901 family phage tail tape measure protein
VAEKIEFQLTVGRDELNSALSAATKEAEKTNKSVLKLSDAFSSAGKEISSIKASFIGNLGANVVSGAFNLLKSAIGATISEARSFSRSIAEVNSILPKTAKLTEDQTKNLIALSSQYGKTPQSQAKAFYEIISGGVEDVGVAFKILKQSNEAAAAGLTEVNVAAKVLTSTFNAFSRQGTTVNQITDSLFQAVKDGQTTFEELSGTLGRVAPLASSVGVRIDEVAGSIAFLTKSGIQTDQAVTGLRSALASIIKPSQEAKDEANRLGLAFSVNGIKSAGGFAEFLEKVKKATNGSSASIAKLFGDVNAINTVIAIANGNFSDFRKTLDSNKNSIGATALASKELKDSFDFKAGQAEQSIKNLATTFSVFLLPALKTTLNGFKALLAISSTTIELDENRKKLKELATQYNDITDAIAIYKKGLGATAQETLFAVKVIKSQADGERQLNDILKERQAIRAATKSPIDGVVKPKTEALIDPIQKAESLKLRRDTFSQLAVAQAEYDTAAQERKLLLIEQGNTEGQAELDALIELEKKKIDAKFLAEEEKNRVIADSVAKEQSIKATQLKKDTEIANKQASITKIKTDAQNKLEQQSLTTRLGYIQAFGNLASTLTTDGSKTQFLIQKAAAIASSVVATQLAAVQALAVPQAPNVGLATTAKIMGGINTAAIAATAIKGFANGGIIGATQGPDNQIATVRTGEMVLNADQQGRLFKALNDGSFGGGEIVIQIDGRTIATAMRDQAKQGFKF